MTVSLAIRRDWPSGSCAELLAGKLDDGGWSTIEVAAADPGGTHADVYQPGPRFPGRPVGPGGEVRGLDSLEISARRLIGDAFVLDRSLIAVQPTTEHEGDVGSAADVSNLPRIIERVEDELERVGDR